MGAKPNKTEDVWLRLDRSQGPDSCWNWLGYVRTNGYGSMSIASKDLSVHRIVYATVYGEIPYGLSVLHTCDNRKCANPKHLYAGTQLENARDAVNRGRQVKGERQRSAKLTEKRVKRIRLLHGAFSYYESAEIFDVHWTSIWNVIAGKTWRHVK
jgi:HNH endonuclease